MVKRLSNKETMKVVIEALRAGKKTWSDLKKLRITVERKKRVIPDKTLERILKDYLKPWKLVEKVDGFWTWHEYTRVFDSRYEYDISLEHCRILLPALSAMLENPVEHIRVDIRPITTKHMTRDLSETTIERLMKEAKTKNLVEQHLQTGYPHIFAEFQTIKRSRTKMKKAQQKKVMELFPKLKGKVKIPGQFAIFDWKKKEPKSLFRKYFPEYDLVRRKIKVMYGPFETEKEAKDILDELDAHNSIITNEEEGSYILGPLFVMNPKMAVFDEAMDEIIEVYKDFASGILKLIMKIESGTPLEGKCDGCPRVKIKETMS